ncbi:MAG: sulfite exporter TauE/SafE family protein, partial [Armatimonadetes bacterium]|nr:sulfite exporter TauE/SafE family protein [Armatimonadota bacterium]
MKRRSLLPIVLTLLLVNCSSAWSQTATQRPTEPVVTGKLLISVDKLRPGDEFNLALKLAVREGYHIGAADQTTLYPAKLTIDAPDSIILDQPVYPKPKRFKGADGTEDPGYEGTFIVRVRGRVKESARQGNITFVASFDSQGCKGNQCSVPETLTSKLTIPIAPRGTPVAKINSETFGPSVSSSQGASKDDDFADRLARYGFFIRLLMLFVFGLLLAFTPCVYPMIPVTIGYFSAQYERRTKRVLLLAAAYVLGLALTYSILGALAATTGRAFGEWMQSPIVPFGIALVLVALAMSMFGLYEIRPPGFIANRSSARSGIAGALIMGLVFGFVAAPCVGPAVLGLLVYVAKIGSPLMGFLLFFAMALGMGTPLFFLAATSAKLPIAGMWMLAVKKLAGFLLIGAAAYFVRPAAPDAIRPYLIPAVIAAAGIYFCCFEKSIKSHRTMAQAGKLFGLVSLMVAIAMAKPHSSKPAIKWQPYSEEAVAKAAANRVPVIIDFTAEWCPAC